MTKKEKITIGLLLPIAVVCLILYVLVTEYSARQESILVYPEGMLSDSLFVSQNNSYTKNDALPNSYAFSSIPYYIDVMAGSTASVGNGSIIQASDDIFIYLSEYVPTEANMDAESILLNEFPSALMIDYNPLYTYSQKLKTQSGYINGFQAEYLFNMITVSNGELSRTAHVAVYDLVSIENAENENAPHILVAAITTTADSQSFAVCKNVIDAMALTIRYDEKLAKKQASAKEDTANDTVTETPSEEVKEENTTPTEPPFPDELDSDNFNYDFEDLIEEGDDNPRFVPLTVKHTYKDMHILVTTDVYVEGSVMTLYNANREKIGEGILSEDKLVTTLQAGEVTEEDRGLFVIKITRYMEYGTVEVDVEDRGQ